MKKTITALLILLACGPVFAQNTANLLSSYMNVKNALVSSNSKAAATAINSFYETVKSENDFTEKAGLLQATGKLSKAGSDLERQRAAFNEVSVVMWKLVKATGKVEQPVYYQYCPMKKGYWLSTESDIKNPYYGASMLSCGSVKETKK